MNTISQAQASTKSYAAYLALIEEHNAKQAVIRADQTLTASERFLAGVKVRQEYDEPIALAILAVFKEGN